jgi:two-component system, LytTR family, response regulator
MIRCLSVDDEPLALDVIEKYIDKIPELQLVEKCTSPLKALEILNKEDIDLIFLDIEMSEINGIQMLKSMTKMPMVIFTTAYENYALDGYELDVLDYLLKPISFERFLKAINKVQEFSLLRKNASFREIPTYENGFLFVKSDYQMVKVNWKDILYIEGLKDYVKIHVGGKPVLSLQNLKSIESKLPSSHFFRVHKSFIVPIHKVDSVHKGRIKIGDAEIPIGENYKDGFLRFINDNDHER